MRLKTRFRRLTSTALALVVLVSSLTCMTVACRAVCAAEARAGAAPAAADLPPCHRAPGAADVPDGSAGDCGSGTGCCSTWLHDRDGFVLAAPGLARAPGAAGFLALVAAGSAFPRPVPALALRSATDPPDPRALHPASPRASRAPPAA